MKYDYYIFCIMIIKNGVQENCFVYSTARNNKEENKDTKLYIKQ